MSQVERKAAQIESFVNAACKYRLILELLNVVHQMRGGEEIGPTEEELLESASVAALLAEAERNRMQ